MTNSSLPFLIFGGAAVCGGVASVILPETRGVRLPETVEDVEIIVRDRRCWSGNQATHEASETQSTSQL